MKFLRRMKGSRGACRQMIARNIIPEVMSPKDNQKCSLADAGRGRANFLLRIDLSMERKIIETP